MLNGDTVGCQRQVVDPSDVGASPIILPQGFGSARRVASNYPTRAHLSRGRLTTAGLTKANIRPSIGNGGGCEGRRAAQDPMEVLFGLALYFAPAIVAASRGHLSAPAIFVVNLLFGWTALGWIVAFVWSLTGNTRSIQMALHGQMDQRSSDRRTLDDIIIPIAKARRDKRQEKRELREALAHHEMQSQRAKEEEEDLLPWKLKLLANNQSNRDKFEDN